MSKRKLDEPEEFVKKQRLVPECPYVSTINRKLLDFDKLKVCSDTLANVNVYTCLVCGKSFSGRGINTPAAKHSLLFDHHLFINLSSTKVYCIPDDYIVEDESLSDILQNLAPKIDVDTLYNPSPLSVSLLGQKYRPGYIGINNLKRTDYLNSVLQILTKIPMFRDYLLRCDVVSSDTLLGCLSAFTKRIWNPFGFKNHVSPNELLNLIMVKSANKYSVGVEHDVYPFLLWLLNSLHEEVSNSKILSKKSCVSDVFCGSIEMTSQNVAIKSNINDPGPPIKKQFPFLTLSLDLPGMPLYKDKLEQNMIPQIPLFHLISKYDGKTETLIPLENFVEKRKFKIQSLPNCLIVHLKRFTTNQWTREKNHTIVKMPIKLLDLKEYCNIEDLGETKYDLYGSICHSGKVDGGQCKSHVYDPLRDVYYEMLDLEVKEIIPEEISISEAYILFYVRRSS
jgi:U4/U6.U5 tri-snRNP-associated protein 2